MLAIYRVSHRYCPARDQDFLYKGAVYGYELNTSCTKAYASSRSGNKKISKKLNAVRFFGIGRKKTQIGFFPISLLLHSTPWLYID